MSNPPKMADVAKAAGVHQSTVSLALREDPRIPAATRIRVREVADQLGYRPNPLVSALIAERRRGRPVGKGTVLAVLGAGQKKDDWRRSSQTYTRLHHAMAEQAHRLGYILDEFALHDPELNAGRLMRILGARGVRGVVLAPMPLHVAAVDFDFTELAAVALRLRLRTPTLDRVAPDYFLAMATALEKLWATGHRRVVFFSDVDTDERVRHRSLGAYLVERQLAPDRCLAPLLVSEWSQKDFIEWLRKHRPDAIITPSYVHYQRVRQWVSEDGWAAPRDLSLINLDCHVDTHEAGMVHNLELEAASAINLLARKVERAEFGVPAHACRLSVPAMWRDGEGFASRV